MEPYSPIEKPLGIDGQAKEKTAPYNWIVLLIIFVMYIVFAMMS